jgi:hypothetical protein
LPWLLIAKEIKNKSVFMNCIPSRFEGICPLFPKKPENRETGKNGQNNKSEALL